MLKSQKIILGILVTLISISFYSCNQISDSPYPTLVLQQNTVMTEIGRASAVAFVINDKAYVTLGRTTNPSDSLKECWQFNPGNNTWIEKAPFPGVARVKATAIVINGKALVGLGFRPHRGGYTGGYLNDFWLYDPISDTWSERKPFPSNAVDACISFVANNTIYVGMGFNGFNFTKELWKYNFENDTWIRLNDFIGTHRSGGICVTADNHVYFGTGRSSVNFDDWWEYLPASDKWTKLKSMPDDGRTMAVALNVNERIFVATGHYIAGYLTGGHEKSDIWEYDSNNNKWYLRGNIPTAGRENAISFCINGIGYIGFGENKNSIHNDLWSFKP